MNYTEIAQTSNTAESLRAFTIMSHPTPSSFKELKVAIKEIGTPEKKTITVA